jgi:2-succinyl-5-enolpyruvyl-6-hydroxy-3-cyclohexene-1-carboxylate synthase
VNPSTTQARVVVDELIRGGVRDVVLCPGSRNAPLAFALHDADRSGRIRLHVRIDERTAGYLAIGLAIAAGAPVCVAMTSGTAVANLGPAVVEANYARVPLIVLSANRPYELLGTGANQTMEQLGYFGTQVRATISLGLAEDAPERLDSLNATWRSATCRVVAAATGSRTANAGPVHFDIPLREPLVPDAESRGAAAPQGRPGGPPGTYTTSRWTSTCPPTPSSSPGTARACTPTWRSCRPSPSPHLFLAVSGLLRCTRWHWRCCTPSR